MAVTIKKKNLTIVSLVTRMFSQEKLAGSDVLHKAQELELQGAKLVTGITQFAIQIDSGKEMTTIAKVPMKLDTVNLAMKKKLGHTVKTILQEKVTVLITEAYQKYMDVEHPAMNYQTNKPTGIECYDKVMAKYHGSKNGNKVAAIKEYRNLTGCSLKAAKDMVENWIDAEELAAGAMPIAEDIIDDVLPVDGEGHTETHDFTKVMEDMKMTQQTVYNVELDLKATPVPLKEATKLNQPVCGTSGGSIYHVVAIGQNCVVAARIRSNNEIALRAELRCKPNSEDGMKVKSGLQFAGLEKKNGGHFSLHLEPEDFAMVKRSIGSTIMAMSIPFWGVSTDLHVLHGVGK